MGCASAIAGGEDVRIQKQVYAEQTYSKGAFASQEVGNVNLCQTNSDLFEGTESQNIRKIDPHDSDLDE